MEPYGIVQFVSQASFEQNYNILVYSYGKMLLIHYELPQQYNQEMPWLFPWFMFP